MAKKNKINQSKGTSSQRQKSSNPESFTHGMVSDLDPHFQLEGSYSDAQNIRLTNSTGDTFTVENIEGNSLFVDLANTHISTPDDQVQMTAGASYPTFYDRGPNTPISALTNLELSNRCSIVGHVSYASQILLMIVGRFNYNRGDVTPFAEQKDRTIFLLVDFDHEMEVTKVTDLRVCYETSGSQYPDLNMDLDIPVRIEHIVENNSISRIYWTDNKNQLRTLNIKQSRLDLLRKESLDITPLMDPSQPVLAATLHGSLPVGVYQYCFKYISFNGGESTFSPLSNMYHVSDQAFGSSSLYGGGPKGNIGTQGFQIDVNDVDSNFAYIELYSLLYDELNQAPKVAIVARRQISGTAEATFHHSVWNNEVPNGLEEILIESNTFDVCKDIAIKDNILFAANLRQKRNFISEKEWNVKVMRWRIANEAGKLDAMLTTNDPEVKHYTTNGGDPVIINDIYTAGYDPYGVTDTNGDRIGYGELLGSSGSMYDSVASANDHLNYDGNLNNPMWFTCLANQRHGAGGSSNKVNQHFQYRYLSDRMTLGGESFDYSFNNLGGCRVSFGVEEKVADESTNAWNSPFISSTSMTGELVTEQQTSYSSGPSGFSSPSGNTTFKASMSLGGSKDPHLAGDKRGYQRGDVYRFGVQTYDLNGSPGNVLWIGDIETPHQYDVLRMINIKNNPLENTNQYSPHRPTIKGLEDGNGSWNSLNHFRQITSHKHCQDHRLSYVYGHTVPPVDVEWFTDRLGNNYRKVDEAYLRPDGDPIHADLRPLSTSGYCYGGRNKALPAHNIKNKGDTYGIDLANADQTHYLFDLYVAFEFRIPDEVCKKIKGFRIVRADRNEQDKRVVQQGLLNQTAQYGNALEGSKYGYDRTRFCVKDNEAFGDDPVFVNPHVATGSGTPSLPEQPEYNVYLNGYLGLAENSHLAFYDTSVNDGKATTGGHTEGDVFYFPEREDGKKTLGDGVGTEFVRGHVAGATTTSNGAAGGPGTSGRHFRHCAYFGSYDKAPHNHSSDGSDVDVATQRRQISSSIFTLDAPDSAFGIRPYVHKEGDFLRIDSSMKLTDEVRFSSQAGFATGGSNEWKLNFPHSYYSHCRINSKKDINDLLGPTWFTAIQQNIHGSLLWRPDGTDSTLKEALSFCSRVNIDNNYSVLVGKYYSYDPYFGIGMEIDGGKFAGSNHDTHRHPDQEYGWQLPIANSKEITDGEIVPSGFFSISKRAKAGMINGFSNNTLGYVKAGWLDDAGNPSPQEKSTWWTFGAVNSSLAFIEAHDEPTNDIASNQKTEIKEADYTYDTVSTMQMGLRSILIEVDNRVGYARKNTGNGLLDHYFNTGGGYNNVNPELNSYTAWFAPINLSALYEHSNWWGEGYKTGVDVWRELHHNPYWRSGSLSHHGEYGMTEDGSDKHTDKRVHFYQKQKDLVPFKYLCSIVRNVTPYGGSDKGSIQKTRYLPCGNFHSVGESTGDTQGHVSQVFGGDTFVNLYSHQKTASPYMKKSASRWQVFPVESYVNTDMRSGLSLNSGDTVVGKEINEPPFSNDWLYNSIYSQENNIKSSLMVDEENFDGNLNLPYEIAYSNTKILGQQSDAFRQFPINQFHDMEGLYGEINRIINFKNEIYVLQDSAFARLLVNPLSMLSDDTGTSLFTGTGETVENHIYISTKYGSRHRFSVSLSEKSLYFVDSNFGRLFKYDTEKLISLGDALGQRNYLKDIIKEWQERAYRTCTEHGYTHDTLKGMLDSKDKPTGSRNYLSDNPLSFLGITSVYDYKNKELLVTFHNSSWSDKDRKRQIFKRPLDNHPVGSTTHGEPSGFSETLVYNEGINAFTSKYNVAPPQWLTGGHGAFLLCPENEINVVSMANFDNITGLNYTGTPAAGEQKYGSLFPYSSHGTHIMKPTDGNTARMHPVKAYDVYFGNVAGYPRVRRCNPLKLWIWDKHAEKKKTHFFGKTDAVSKPSNIASPIDSTQSSFGIILHTSPLNDLASESYIEKIINSEAASSKVFDNAKLIMTPDHVDFSSIDYTTDITHDTINIKSTIDNKTTTLDETEQLVINRRWDFKDSSLGWSMWIETYSQLAWTLVPAEEALLLTFDHVTAALRSPFMGDEINLIGKYNNIIRMRVKRYAAGATTPYDKDDWIGRVYWTGYDPIKKENGTYLRRKESTSRMAVIDEPEGLENDYKILEWDMSDVPEWNDCIIQQIRISLSGGSGGGINFNMFYCDWIEIGGLNADKYIDGSLRIPLRTEKSTRRTRGTWAKIKYSVKTTEKFNIFAILAKYRKTY